ncbi:MAG: FRG domain-containing protein [Sedimentisphaerales bacterium]|nr:FRG domain-containing protein [Sedimentisphaerales bacterium]
MSAYEDNMENNNKKLADLRCESHPTENWDGLQKVYEDNKFDKRDKETLWIFRAEKRRKKSNHKDLSNSEKYELENSYFKTSLEKAFDHFKPHKDDKEGKHYTKQDLEKNLLWEFQRKAHHYLKHVPKPDNIIEWLTLMQHYEGPTRILDWTYSFYVALFFALARLDCDKEYAEVWVANSKPIRGAEEKFCRKYRALKKAAKLRKKDSTKMDDLHNGILNRIFENPEKQIFVLNSFRLNERLIAQQGTFLVQGDINETFDENLKGIQGFQNSDTNLHRIVIDIDIVQRNDTLKKLNSMNINNATLFPGLQGFAESLASKLAYPENFGREERS